jgi:NAD(P)H-dependent flavin oxidoreductase YrpB (nitropropane dioxygenase family)
LNDSNAPFGVDLLLPQVGGNARKTNYDYTKGPSRWQFILNIHLLTSTYKGKLNELIDVIIDEKTTLFVCAVGVPPPEIVKKLHDAGILVMNVRFYFLL